MKRVYQIPGVKLLGLVEAWSFTQSSAAAEVLSSYLRVQYSNSNSTGRPLIPKSPYINYRMEMSEYFDSFGQTQYFVLLALRVKLI